MNFQAYLYRRMISHCLTTVTDQRTDIHATTQDSSRFVKHIQELHQVGPSTVYLLHNWRPDQVCIFQTMTNVESQRICVVPCTAELSDYPSDIHFFTLDCLPLDINNNLLPPVSFVVSIHYCLLDRVSPLHSFLSQICPARASVSFCYYADPPLKWTHLHSHLF
jgi:hypothetical protein